MNKQEAEQMNLFLESITDCGDIDTLLLGIEYIIQLMKHDYEIPKYCTLFYADKVDNNVLRQWKKINDPDAREYIPKIVALSKGRLQRKWNQPEGTAVLVLNETEDNGD